MQCIERFLDLDCVIQYEPTMVGRFQIVRGHFLLHFDLFLARVKCCTVCGTRDNGFRRANVFTFQDEKQIL